MSAEENARDLKQLEHAGSIEPMELEDNIGTHGIHLVSAGERKFSLKSAKETLTATQPTRRSNLFSYRSYRTQITSSRRTSNVAYKLDQVISLEGGQECYGNSHLQDLQTDYERDLTKLDHALVACCRRIVATKGFTFLLTVYRTLRNRFRT